MIREGQFSGRGHRATDDLLFMFVVDRHAICQIEKTSRPPGPPLTLLFTHFTPFHSFPFPPSPFFSNSLPKLYIVFVKHRPAFNSLLGKKVVSVAYRSFAPSGTENSWVCWVRGPKVLCGWLLVGGAVKGGDR